MGEAVGGFAARFPEEEKLQAERLLLKVDSNATTLPEEEAALTAKALSFALHELGREEFSTITGYEFDFGNETLERIRVGSCRLEVEIKEPT